MKTNQTDQSKSADEIKPINLTGRFIADSVVACREESDVEGALLYNPDADTITLINRSGLMIWKYLSIPRNLEEIVAFLQTQFLECPDESVLKADIIETLSRLAPDFIHEVK